MGKDNLKQFDKLSKHSDNSECFSGEEYNVSITDNPNLEGFRLFLNNNGNAPLFTKEEEYELGIKVKNGDLSAREKLIVNNIRLVVSIARRYVGLGLDFDDLIEEGIIGLIIAVDKFEPEKHLKFSTYATYWIRQSMRRGITNKSRTIRIPVHAFDTMLSMKKFMEDYYKMHGVEPEEEVVAKGINITVSRLKKLKRLTSATSSLDLLVGSDNDTILSDLLTDEDCDVEKDILFKELALSLEKGINSLTDKERSVILRKYGFLGNTTSLADIGRYFGVTRESIRRRESSALNKLNKPVFTRDYKNHMYDNYSNDFFAKSKREKENEKFYDLISLMNDFGIEFNDEEIKILLMLKGLDKKQVSINSMIKDGYEKDYLVLVLNKFTSGLRKVNKEKVKIRK